MIFSHVFLLRACVLDLLHFVRKRYLLASVFHVRKRSNLFAPSVFAQNIAFSLLVVSINANEALVSQTALNSEPFFHVLVELSLKCEITVLEVFSKLPVSMIVALIELAYVHRILRCVDPRTVAVLHPIAKVTGRLFFSRLQGA